MWFVARYTAAVDPETARRWLTLAERISTEFEAAPSLEEVLRAETMEVLGITDMDELLATGPHFDPAAPFDEVAAWVAARSPSKVAPRVPVRH